MTVPSPQAAALERLETAVGRLLEAYETVRERARLAEEAHEKLRAAMGGSSVGDRGEDVEERLADLAAENRRLRERLSEARERAERIRQRLMVVEDEL